jgi:hypothetical protein
VLLKTASLRGLTPEIQENASGTHVHPMVVFCGEKQEGQNEVHRADRSF